MHKHSSVCGSQNGHLSNYIKFSIFTSLGSFPALLQKHNGLNQILTTMKSCQCIPLKKDMGSYRQQESPEWSPFILQSNKFCLAFSPLSPQLKHSAANLINTCHWRNTQLNLKFSCDGISALFHSKLCKWLVIMSVKKIKLYYESELVWLSLPVSNFCSAFSRVRILSGMRNIISVCGPISVWPSTQK